MSVSLYVGIPQSGKTTLARRRAGEDVVAHDLPCLVLDSEGANNLSDIPRAPDMAGVFHSLYGRRRNVRYVPAGEEDVERLAAGVRDGRNLVFLVDEFGYWASSHKILPSMKKILRAHNHANIHLHATTQYLSDLAPLALQCYDHLYVFRTISARGIERLQDEYRVPPEKVYSLAPGCCLHLQKWGSPGAWEELDVFAAPV